MFFLIKLNVYIYILYTSTETAILQNIVQFVKIKNNYTIGGNLPQF